MTMNFFRLSMECGKIMYGIPNQLFEHVDIMGHYGIIKESYGIFGEAMEIIVG